MSFEVATGMLMVIAVGAPFEGGPRKGACKIRCANMGTGGGSVDH